MVDRRNQEKLYIQIMRLLVDEIGKQTWRVGERIPSENELGVRYGVSKITIRQALTNLAADGYLMKVQGADSFSRDEVKAALANAHEDMPGNFSRDFAETASKNLIASKQGEPGRYIVPRTGRTAVESQFQDVPRRRANRKAKKAASKAAAE